MSIDTKFNIFDKVYFILDDVIKKGTINKIVFRKEQDFYNSALIQEEVSYRICGYNNKFFKESCLALSVDELIDRL